VDILHHLGQVAAVILLVELLVVVLIFAAVAGGASYGLHWVRGKSGWAFGQVNHYTSLGAKYVHIGSDYVGVPFIKLGRVTDTVSGTAEAARASVRRERLSSSSSPEVAARPVPAEASGETDAEGLT